jgi:hypothetical protein
MPNRFAYPNGLEFRRLLRTEYINECDRLASDRCEYIERVMR